MLGEFLIAAYGAGYELTLGHVWRDTEAQRRLVEAGLSKTMRSKHCDRLAVDLNLFIDGKYVDSRDAYRGVGELWEGMGGSWGGRFGVSVSNYKKVVGWDPGHFEYKD
jgi:hypothetical protein